MDPVSWGDIISSPLIIVCIWMFGSLAILGITFEVRDRFSCSLSNALLLSTLGILNLLYWGTFLSFAVVQIPLFGLGLFCLIKRKSQFEIKNSFSLLLIILFSWFSYTALRSAPFAWDEFFWTLFDQHINYSYSYWDKTSGILASHIRYVPGPTLWHNFFAIKGFYHESTAYFANSFLYVALLYWIVDTGKKENHFFLTVILIAAVGCFSEGWYTTYVDALNGLFIGICLLAAMRYFKGSQCSFFILILALSSNLLIKETGLISLLAFIGAAFTCFIFAMKPALSWKRTAIIILYCFSIIFSWKFYLKHIEVGEVLSLNLFSQFPTDHHIQVLKKFVKYAVHDRAMISIWILSLIVIYELKKTYQAKFSLMNFILLLIGYISVHVLYWVFMNGVVDGLTLAAKHRYMGTLLLGIFVFCSSLMASRISLKILSKLVLVSFLYFVPPSSLKLLLTPNRKEIKQIKQLTENLKQRIPRAAYALCKENPTKIWFIYQNSVGFEVMIARHLLTPCQVSFGAFSLGEPYYQGDRWTDGFGDELFLSWAEKYPFMITARIDEQFIQKYGHFFTKIPISGGLYSFDQKNLKYLPLEEKEFN